MKRGHTPGDQEDAPRPRRGAALWAVLFACVSAMVLGPVAALAAAGKPADSGGAGLITTSQNGATVTVGTTTLVATQPTTTTVVNGTTTTTAGSCTVPVVGTVTTTTTPSPSSGSAPGAPVSGAPVSGDTSTSCSVGAPTAIPAPKGSPVAKRGMWIWELPATDGGNLTRVIAQAKRYGIGTVYVKSGDGNAVWSQFTPALVNAFHAAGLDVCAWQYVYGDAPLAEAQVGIRSAATGADCLVIDAESQYQRKYVQAQRYMTALRAGVGSQYPIALAGFPYVDYHPTFPYSVFLGPGGAQFNLPQMYWRDIGTSVDAVYAHTFAFNELYQRPIYPLGQLYDSPPSSQVRKFRSVGLAYRTGGISWWDWQSAKASQFSAIAAPAGPIPGYRANTTVAALSRGAVGDLVVLAQEHLWNTRERVGIDGGFGARTQRAIRAFQRNNGLGVSGVITPQTWNRLLGVPVPKITWVTRGRSVVASVSTTATG